MGSLSHWMKVVEIKWNRPNAGFGMIQAIDLGGSMDNRMIGRWVARQRCVTSWGEGPPTGDLGHRKEWIGQLATTRIRNKEGR